MTGMQSEVELALTSSSTSRAREQRTPGSAMKKYTKLVLALVAVISSLAFLIYKYRYDRLYHVMQVSQNKPLQSLISIDISIFRFSKCLATLTSLRRRPRPHAAEA